MKNFILATALLFSPLLASAQLGQFGGGGSSAGGCSNPTTGVIPVKSGSSTCGDSHLTDSSSFTSDSSGNVGVTSLKVGAGFASNSSTTNSKLAKLSAGNIIAALTTDTNIPVWIVSSGGGTASVYLSTDGQSSCVFDGATTAGDYVVASSSTAADCSDGGATLPTSKWVIGQVLTTNGGGGTYTVQLSQGYSPSSGGSAVTELWFVTGDSLNSNSCVLTTGGICYIGRGGLSAISVGPTEANIASPNSISGTVASMYCHSLQATGSGVTWALVLRQDSASITNGPACTITNASLDCNSTGNIGTITAGHTLDIQGTIAGGTIQNQYLRCSVKVTGAN